MQTEECRELEKQSRTAHFGDKLLIVGKSNFVRPKLELAKRRADKASFKFSAEA